MAGADYVLTGFGDFLERRRISFTEPLPSIRVCGVCGLVPSRTLLLPCGHVLCQHCRDQISKEAAACPLDGKMFTDTDLVPMTFKQSYLEEQRVFCVAGGQKCSFAGKLCELKEHLIRCGSDNVMCTKCHRSVVRSFAVKHYQQCSAETCSRQAVSTTTALNVVEKLSSMKSDLESVRKQASSDKPDQDAVVNGANSLLERMASLERDLMQEEWKAGGDRCGSSLPTLEKAVAYTGPYRAASKAGAFITMCEFSEIYAGYNALHGDNKEHRLSSEAHTLAGYTFNLDCKLQKQEDGDVAIMFVMFLRDGAWDDWLEWPFSRKVTIVIAHPRDKGRDVRLPVNMDDPRVVKKPAPRSSNWGLSTKALGWKDLELQGFPYNRNLYVNVEFE